MQARLHVALQFVRFRKTSKRPRFNERNVVPAQPPAGHRCVHICLGRRKDMRPASGCREHSGAVWAWQCYVLSHTCITVRCHSRSFSRTFKEYIHLVRDFTTSPAPLCKRGLPEVLYRVPRKITARRSVWCGE